MVVSDLFTRFPQKLDHVPHGAPAGHRAESRPDIRLVGTVTGRRFEAPQRWLESTDIAESMVAFPCRSMILPAQVRCRRNQADIGPRLAATPDLRRGKAFLDAPAFPQLGDEPKKEVLLTLAGHCALYGWKGRIRGG